MAAKKANLVIESCLPMHWMNNVAPMYSNGQLKIEAVEDIKRGDIIFAEEPHLSVNIDKKDNLLLPKELLAMNKEDLDKLVERCAELYPREEKDKLAALADMFPQANNVVLELLKVDPVSLVRMYMTYNNFIVNNKYQCLYSYGSMFNHSCYPNCVIGFDDIMPDTKIMSIMAARDIAKGEECTICYLEGTKSYYEAKTTEQRRAIIKDIMLFDCTCTSCTGVTNGTIADVTTDLLTNKPPINYDMVLDMSRWKCNPYHLALQMKAISATTPRCATCKTKASLKYCSRCGKVQYCSTTCQRKDWPSHKARCGK